MGFGREARSIRDPALPLGYRVHALGSCITMAQPIGFHATWSYLEARVQRPWRAPEFLVPAIDLLENQRRLQLRMLAEYAGLRRGQKAAGLRFPRRCDVTPSDPYRWHGDERLGARHALQFFSPLQDQALARHAFGQRALVAVDSALGERGAEVEVEELQGILDWARRQVHVIGWDADRSEYRVAWVTYRLLGQLHVMQNGATQIGTPWNFRV